MTGDEIITKFENSVDDTLGSDFVLQLANDAINEFEASKDWSVLTKQTTVSITEGSSYTTTYSLPTRFANEISVIESDDTFYRKIDFTDHSDKVNSSQAYFLDMANDSIGFAGSNLTAVTVNLYYTEYSADITTATSWSFPARFHKYIVYKMAEIYYAVDAGEKARAWNDQWSIFLQRGVDQMEMWDDRLKARNRSNRITRNREDSLNLRR